MRRVVFSFTLFFYRLLFIMLLLCSQISPKRLNLLINSTFFLAQKMFKCESKLDKCSKIELDSKKNLKPLYFNKGYNFYNKPHHLAHQFFRFVSFFLLIDKIKLKKKKNKRP